MKNLKNYAMTLVALVIAIGSLTLMSMKENYTTLNTQWFNASESSSEVIIADRITLPSSPCDQLTGDLCAVELDLQNVNSTNLENLYDQMDNPSQPNPTLQNFLDAGAQILAQTHKN